MACDDKRLLGEGGATANKKKKREKPDIMETPYGNAIGTELL